MYSLLGCGSPIQFVLYSSPIVRLHSTPHTRGYHKICESFYFRLLSQVQKLLSCVDTGLKNTPQTVSFCP